MDLGTMSAAVREEVNSNTTRLPKATLDRKIVEVVRRLERAEDWAYLDRFVEFTLDEDERSVSFPSTRVKAWEFIRINDDNEFTYLNRVQPSRVSQIKTETPNGYWFDARDYIWFDNIADEDYAMEASFTELTDIASFGDSFEPWLMVQCQDLIIYEAVVVLAPYLRWPKVLALYKGLRDEALKTALDADAEFKYSGAALAEEDMRMQYGSV